MYEKHMTKGKNGMTCAKVAASVLALALATTACEMPNGVQVRSKPSLHVPFGYILESKGNSAGSFAGKFLNPKELNQSMKESGASVRVDLAPTSFNQTVNGVVIDLTPEANRPQTYIIRYNGVSVDFKNELGDLDFADMLDAALDVSTGVVTQPPFAVPLNFKFPSSITSFVTGLTNMSMKVSLTFRGPDAASNFTTVNGNTAENRGFVKFGLGAGTKAAVSCEQDGSPTLVWTSETVSPFLTTTECSIVLGLPRGMKYTIDIDVDYDSATVSIPDSEKKEAGKLDLSAISGALKGIKFQKAIVYPFVTVDAGSGGSLTLPDLSVWAEYDGHQVPLIGDTAGTPETITANGPYWNDQYASHGYQGNPSDTLAFGSEAGETTSAFIDMLNSGKEATIYYQFGSSSLTGLSQDQKIEVSLAIVLPLDLFISGSTPVNDTETPQRSIDGKYYREMKLEQLENLSEGFNISDYLGKNDELSGVAITFSDILNTIDGTDPLAPASDKALPDDITIALKDGASWYDFTKNDGGRTKTIPLKTDIGASYKLELGSKKELPKFSILLPCKDNVGDQDPATSTGKNAYFTVPYTATENSPKARLDFKVTLDATADVKYDF